MNNLQGELGKFLNINFNVLMFTMYNYIVSECHPIKKIEFNVLNMAKTTPIVSMKRTICSNPKCDRCFCVRSSVMWENDKCVLCNESALYCIGHFNLEYKSIFDEKFVYGPCGS
jgi:hypothetical protein